MSDPFLYPLIMQMEVRTSWSAGYVTKENVMNLFYNHAFVRYRFIILPQILTYLFNWNVNWNNSIVQGSVGCVHASCLKVWLEQSNTSRCELCNYPYAIKQTRKYSKCVSVRVFFGTVISKKYVSLVSTRCKYLKRLYFGISLTLSYNSLVLLHYQITRLRCNFICGYNTFDYSWCCHVHSGVRVFNERWVGWRLQPSDGKHHESRHDNAECYHSSSLLCLVVYIDFVSLQGNYSIILFNHFWNCLCIEIIKILMIVRHGGSGTITASTWKLFPLEWRLRRKLKQPKSFMKNSIGSSFLESLVQVL